MKSNKAEVTFPVHLFPDSKWKMEAGLSTLEIAMDDSRNDLSSYRFKEVIYDFMEFGNTYEVTISINKISNEET